MNERMCALGSDSGDSGLLSLKPARGLLHPVCDHSSSSPPHSGQGPGPFLGPALHRLCAQTPGGHQGEGAWLVPGAESGKRRGESGSRRGGLSCGPPGGLAPPHLPQKPGPSSIFTLQTDRETKAWRGATSRSQGAKKAGAPRIQAQVLAWLIDPQAGAQLMEDMVMGLGMLKPFQEVLPAPPRSLLAPSLMAHVPS